MLEHFKIVSGHKLYIITADFEAGDVFGKEIDIKKHKIKLIYTRWKSIIVPEGDIFVKKFYFEFKNSEPVVFYERLALKKEVKYEKNILQLGKYDL